MPPSHVSELVALFNNGEFKKIERKAEKALRTSPNDVSLLNIFGAALLQQGKTIKARRIFEKALTKDAAYAPLHSSLGMVYRVLGDIPKAIESYGKAIKLRPDDVIALNNLGNVYSDAADYQNAAKCFEMALDIEPAFTMARNSLAVAHFSMNAFDLALATIDQSIAQDPTLIASYALKANFLEKLNRIVEAVALVSDALRAAPEDPQLLIAAARLDIRQKRFESAHDKLNAAASHTTELSELDQAEAMFLLAECLDKLQRYEEAFHVYGRANFLRSQTSGARSFRAQRYLDQITLRLQALDANHGGERT